MRDLTVVLASPRGFCAGVERAVGAVEEALAVHGAPVYVRHEIVHNIHVVNRLKAMGAVFVENVADAPPDRPIVFSAHGAPKSAHDLAALRGVPVVDATCPLVHKVHAGIRRHVARGRHVVLVGHRGHPEVEGTMGQVPEGSVSLVETIADIERLDPPPGTLAYATQTTLSMDDAAAAVAALKRRFPDIEGPKGGDICYATQNRQNAAKAIAPTCDMVLVIGSPASSNSRRLVDVARGAGCPQAELVEDPRAFDLARLNGVRRLGVTSGASAPEELVEDFLARLALQFHLRVKTVEVVKEDVVFKRPLVAAE
ncbi:MAG: 4-hydroxy-3-methylbut-2-enyl diphosphate reductase [Parvularculaceae bacterium]|jgi:4-hydroxy-3-methylbut-2-enyl diphosphate reductase|nr:4-hydroxy-3-methylbut-2-enyl diphosphate reductase [Parvularculaceae bacterium]